MKNLLLVDVDYYCCPSWAEVEHMGYDYAIYVKHINGSSCYPVLSYYIFRSQKDERKRCEYRFNYSDGLLMSFGYEEKYAEKDLTKTMTLFGITPENTIVIGGSFRWMNK
jgi:hypothetical protein